MESVGLETSVDVEAEDVDASVKVSVDSSVSAVDASVLLMAVTLLGTSDTEVPEPGSGAEEYVTGSSWVASFRKCCITGTST